MTQNWRVRVGGVVRDAGMTRDAGIRRNNAGVSVSVTPSVCIGTPYRPEWTILCHRNRDGLLSNVGRNILCPNNFIFLS